MYIYYYVSAYTYILIYIYMLYLRIYIYISIYILILCIFITCMFYIYLSVRVWNHFLSWSTFARPKLALRVSTFHDENRPGKRQLCMSEISLENFNFKQNWNQTRYFEIAFLNQNKACFSTLSLSFWTNRIPDSTLKLSFNNKRNCSLLIVGF